MLHAVDVDSPDDISTGLRVRARWASERIGQIDDIDCFEPGETRKWNRDSRFRAPILVTMITTPIDLHFMHTASSRRPATSAASRRASSSVVAPDPNDRSTSRRAARIPTNGKPTSEQVELSDKGMVTTFCIVNVPFLGQQIKPPYVAAYVLLDGADIPFLHLILECEAADVHMGMRVEAVWRPREEWDHTLRTSALPSVR